MKGPEEIEGTLATIAGTARPALSPRYNCPSPRQFRKCSYRTGPCKKQMRPGWPPSAGTNLAPCDIEVFLTTQNIARLAVVAVLVAVAAGCSSSDPLSPTAASTTGGGTVSDFQGQYTGTYRVNDCVEAGFFTGFCEGTGLVAGVTPPISLTLSQNQSAVSGNVLLGQITGTFSGTVSGSTLTGTAVMTDIAEQDVTLSTKISTWTDDAFLKRVVGGIHHRLQRARTSRERDADQHHRAVDPLTFHVPHRSCLLFA